MEEDLTDSIKAGKANWNSFYNKKLLKESFIAEAPKANGDDGDERELLANFDEILADKKKDYQKAVRDFNAAKESFKFRLTYDIKAAGKSIGAAHYSVNDYDKAIQVFMAPDQKTKDQILGPANTFDYDLFLNDYTAKAGKGSQAPGKRVPYTVYKQTHLQGDVNEVLFPLITVLLAGPEKLEHLKSEIPELFHDDIVTLFLKTYHLQKHGLLIKEKIKNVEQKRAELVKKLSSDMQAPAPEEPEVAAEPEVAQNESVHISTKSGPGKVCEQLVETEQKDTDADISSQRKKQLNESWKNYSATHKNDKNNEKPDKFTILLG